MRIRAHHRFDAPLGAVEAALVQPSFYESLALPDVAPPEVLAAEPPPAARVRVRFEFEGSLDPVVRRVVGTERIAWLQELRVDTTTHVGELHVVPEGRVPAECRARVVLRASEGITERVVDGELRVRIPLIGGRAEQSIGRGVLRRLDLEAEALAAYLRV